MANLIEYLNNQNPTEEFKPYAEYIPEADSIEFFFEPDQAYAERVDNVLTVYMTMDGDHIVGCEIKGIKHLLDVMGNFGLKIKEQHISLSFFFAASILNAKPDKIRTYQKLAKEAEDTEAAVNKDDLISA